MGGKLVVRFTQGETVELDDCLNFEFNADGVLYVYLDEEQTECCFAAPSSNVLYVDYIEEDNDEQPAGKETSNEYDKRCIPPDPGPGYRLIDKSVDTPQKGDEYFSFWHGAWQDRCQWDTPFGPEDFYRRRITPEPVCKREAFSGGGSPSPRQCGVCGEGPCAKQPVEKWPKYYVGRLWSTEDAYVRIDSRDGDGVWVNQKGQESKIHARYPTPENPTCWSWDEVTKEQAMARVTHPQQVESPDDWVTQDRVPYRKAFDQCRWSVDLPGVWYENQQEVGYMHGYRFGGMHFEIRCRRKDLPPLPATIHIGDSVVITEDPKRDDSWNGCRRTVQAKVKNGYVVGKVGEPISRIYLERELRVVPKPDGE